MKRGWIVTFSALGINLALGVLYTWTAIASTLTRSAADGGRFFWTPQQATLPYAVAVGCFSLSMLIAGRLQDAFGPRLVATGGGALIGIGMLVASLSPAHLESPSAIPVRMVLGFGVLAGCGIGLASAATAPAAAKWSSAGRRGIVLGVVVSGFGGAAVFAHPLVATLVRAYGLSGTFLFLGVVLFVVIVSLAQLLADPPVGFVPPGSYTEEPSSIGPKTAPRESTAGQTVRTPSLYALWAALACSAFGVHVVSQVLPTIAAGRFGPAGGFPELMATFALALGVGLGGPAAGALSDRIGRQHTILAVLVAQSALMGSLRFAVTQGALSAVALGLGFCAVAVLALFPATTFDFFGTKHGGANYGLVFTGWGVGGVFAAYTVGRLLERGVWAGMAAAAYTPTLTLAAALCLLGAALTFLIRPPDPTGEHCPFAEPGASRQA